MMRWGRSSLTVAVVSSLFVAACSPPPPAGIECGTFGSFVDPFPTPVSAGTSLFDEIDDDFLEVLFTSLSFPFYGETYDSVFVNTNGGLTFGAGDRRYDVAAESIDLPAIAVFWGDMDAGEYGADTRADQMRWRQSASCFQVAYDRYQDYDDASWHNSAVVTLVDDGRIRVEYGTVLSEDILVGVFDGSGTDDRAVGLASSYVMSQLGTGIVVYDAHGAGPDHLGALSGTTIDYLP